MDVSRETFYFNGSFEGKPAFLGYFLEVPLFLAILTNDRSASVPGNKKVFTSFTLPPNKNMACFAAPALLQSFRTYME